MSRGYHYYSKVPIARNKRVQPITIQYGSGRTWSLRHQHVTVKPRSRPQTARPARWVEIRDLLPSGDGEIIGLQEEPDLSFVLGDPETSSVFVVSMPDAGAIQSAVQSSVPGANVIAT